MSAPLVMIGLPKEEVIARRKAALALFKKLMKQAEAADGFGWTNKRLKAKQERLRAAADVQYVRMIECDRALTAHAKAQAELSDGKPFSATRADASAPAPSETGEKESV